MQGKVTPKNKKSLEIKLQEYGNLTKRKTQQNARKKQMIFGRYLKISKNTCIIS